MTTTPSTRSRFGYLVTLAAGVLIGLAAVGSAAAAPGGGAAQTVTHRLALAASAFAPNAIADPAGDYNNQWDPTSLTNNGARCFNAGLQLPANATLKSVTFYYSTGSPAMNFEVNRQNLTNHQDKILISGQTTTTVRARYASFTLRFPASAANVDYSRYAYSVGVCPIGTTSFSGLIIRYTQPA